MQECLSFQNNHPLSSSECCNVLTVQQSGLVPCQAAPAATQQLSERWVGAGYLDLALDMSPCPLSCFFGIAHPEDARRVVEPSCACPALPSCWFSDAVLLPQVCIQKIMEKRLTSWKELKNESLNAYRLHLKAVPFVLYSRSAVVDIYNWYKHMFTQFLHVCMKKMPEIPIYFPQASPLQTKKSHVKPPAWATVFFMAQPEGEVISCLQEVCVLLCWQNRALDGFSGK